MFEIAIAVVVGFAGMAFAHGFSTNVAKRKGGVAA
jgi:predicted lipoprotein with Yx(FWY)xxD motif